MSDWKIGDLALCIHDSFSGALYGSLPSQHPAQNAVYRVVETRERYSFTFLVFAEFAGKGWNDCAFRKILPDKHESCEPEFVQLLKRSKVTA